MSKTRTKILDSAEKMVRAGGYNGFSFREIAAEIGIKSSSVHHHFATKEVLAEAVAQRYMEAFFAALGEPDAAGATAITQIKRYCDLFQTSFVSANSSCLCGVLSNETLGIPATVTSVVDEFFEQNVAWLTRAIALDVDSAETKEIAALAYTIYAALEGAISVASLKQDPRVLRTVSDIVLNLIQHKLK